MILNFTGFEQQIFFHEKSFVPKIYSGNKLPDERFNVVHIRLDVSDRATLRWKEEYEKGKEAVQKGFFILWELDFALLEGSLEDAARFLTLQLGLEHFCKNIWPTFQNETFGVILFKGRLDLNQRDCVIDYLKNLAIALPENIACFLLLDTSEIVDPVSYFRLTSLHAFGHFYLMIKGQWMQKYPFALPALSWDHNSSVLGSFSNSSDSLLQQKRIQRAICLPDEMEWIQLKRVLEKLESPVFRMIPEKMLTHEWDGIDELIVFSQTLSARGKRKLSGFLAAGGEVIRYPDDEASLQLLETSQPSSLAVSLQNDR